MKSKAHTIYKLKNGDRVPGVTTITGQLHKPALVPWANKLGLNGIDVNKYVDDKASIGTLCHTMILDYFRKQKTNTDDYTKNQIDQAENSFLSFLEWAKQHMLEPILIEQPLVSEVKKYGGTSDYYGNVDGIRELLDFKTGSGIYKEMWYQVAGYGNLLNEQGNYPMKYRILNIPRTEDEGFKEDTKTDVQIGKYFDGFIDLLNFYYHNKQTT